MGSAGTGTGTGVQLDLVPSPGCSCTRVQLDLSLLLACLLPLCCVGGHPGLPGIQSGQLGQWPGISFVQVGHFQVVRPLVWW